MLGNSRSILLVEDDVDIREALEEILGDEGYHVISAKDGKEGLARLQSSEPRPALCLLDRFLPVMSGEEVLLEIERRSTEAWTEVPVVLLSAAEFSGAMPGKPAGFLRKPVELEELMEVVHRYCD